MTERRKSRRLSPREKDLLVLLLASADRRLDAGTLELIEAEPMEDGRMGSLYFPRPDKPRDPRRFGARIAQTEFTDHDGVLVSVSLNVDQDDHLLELDVWKTDFSPVISLSH